MKYVLIESGFYGTTAISTMIACDNPVEIRNDYLPNYYRLVELEVVE